MEGSSRLSGLTRTDWCDWQILPGTFLEYVQILTSIFLNSDFLQEPQSVAEHRQRANEFLMASYSEEQVLKEAQERVHDDKGLRVDGTDA